MAGKPGCGGKPGRSGRRPKKVDATWDKLAARGCEYLVQNFNYFPEEKKIVIALEMMKKYVSSKVEHDHNITFAQMIKGANETFTRRSETSNFLTN